MRPEVTDRAAFLRELTEAAEHITDTGLDVLLEEGGWRERKTAAWFMAVSGRTRFREKLGALLHAAVDNSILLGDLDVRDGTVH